MWVGGKGECVVCVAAWCDLLSKLCVVMVWLADIVFHAAGCVMCHAAL